MNHSAACRFVLTAFLLTVFLLSQVAQANNLSISERGNGLTLQSGADTNLIGAVASGKQVTANIGGNLTLASLQDTSSYNSQQSSAGFSVSVPLTGGGISGSINAGNSRINNQYASVTEQAGIKAGDNGFQVKVGGNTDLKGAVIASSDQAIQNHQNSLTTASLSSSDLQNHASYTADSTRLGIGGSANPAGVTPSISPPIAMSTSGDSNSTTRSGISGGAISITDQAKQQALTGKDVPQTLAATNRAVTTGTDTTHALSNNFNPQAIQTAFAVTQAFTGQVGTYLGNRAAETTAAQQTIKDVAALGSVSIDLKMRGQEILCNRKSPQHQTALAYT